MNTNIPTGLETLYQWESSLSSAPTGVLVLLACLAAGYIVKFLPFVDNKWIPLIVIVVGLLSFPLLSCRPPTEPVRVWLVRCLILGFVSSCFAWLAHNQLLKRLERRLGLFSADKDPAPPVA